MPTIEELAPYYKRYLEHERRLSRLTITAYMSDLRLLAGALPPLEVSAIRTIDLRHYLMSLSEGGLKPRSIQRKAHGFRTFWNWLLIEGYIAEDVTQRIRLPRLARPLPTWLTEEELKRFVMTPDTPRNTLAWKLLAWFGLRRSELLNLKVGDIRIQEAAILIRKSKAERERLLYIPPELMSDLQAAVKAVPPGDYLLRGVMGGRWSLGSFHRHFNAHVKRCGLDETVTPHTLRHSVASHLIRRGASIIDVKQLLGHADIKTTAVYLHTDQRQQRSMMALHYLAQNVTQHA